MVEKKIILEDFEEIIERKVKKCGHSGHVIIPRNHVGKEVLIVVKKE